MRRRHRGRQTRETVEVSLGSGQVEDPSPRSGLETRENHTEDRREELRNMAEAFGWGQGHYRLDFDGGILLTMLD